ncbi:MAG: signal peptidase I, partial [Oscillospiraceae bacterium]
MKNVLKNIVSVLSWIILIFALIATVFAFTADRSSGVTSVFGFIPMTVESDSMAPTFSKNDLIIDREIEDVTALQEDDVITFWTLINGQRVRNTHRIIEVSRENGNISFTTKGDNNDAKDTLRVYPADIIGKWDGLKLAGFGAVINFLRTQLGFCICVIVPLVLFFLFELYKLIVVIVEIKRPAAAEIDEEEIKRRAIEEYIA